MGLDECNHLSSAVIDRGIECLTRFAGRLGDVNNSRLRVVATNTLRRAVNSQEFIVRANDILPVHIEIISGREEARLIYLGVSHTCPSHQQRFVVDIGGGSTELIIGKNLNPILTESTQMGVAGFTQQFFLEMATSTHCLLKRRFMSPKKEIIKYGSHYKKNWF